jgi:hypothetical protein
MDEIANYSEHLTTQLVWYSNGPNLSYCEVIWFSDHKSDYYCSVIGGEPYWPMEYFCLQIFLQYSKKALKQYTSESRTRFGFRIHSYFSPDHLISGPFESRTQIRLSNGRA